MCCHIYRQWIECTIAHFQKSLPLIIIIELTTKNIIMLLLILFQAGTCDNPWIWKFVIDISACKTKHIAMNTNFMHLRFSFTGCPHNLRYITTVFFQVPSLASCSWTIMKMDCINNKWNRVMRRSAIITEQFFFSLTTLRKPTNQIKIDHTKSTFECKMKWQHDYITLYAVANLDPHPMLHCTLSLKINM